MRSLVKRRDKGICALCGVDTNTREQGWRWEMDHVVPVVEGGGLCGLDGYRTLCVPCHKSETAALAKRRAQARKDEQRPLLKAEA
jgi:5-methylcytosine-specific restriction endonuclease McrA